MAEVTLTKEKFVRDYVAEKGGTLKAAGEVYDFAFGAIRETIEANGRVPIAGVGVLCWGDLKGREYPIPGTTDKVAKGARKRVKVSAAVVKEA